MYSITSVKSYVFYVNLYSVTIHFNLARGPVKSMTQQQSRMAKFFIAHLFNNLACWIINLLLDVLLCSIAENFLLVVCILTRPTGSSKYGTTHKNTQRYHTTKRPTRYNSIYLLENWTKVSLTTLTKPRVLSKILQSIILTCCRSECSCHLRLLKS